MAVKEVIIHSDETQDFNYSIRVLAGPGAGKTFWITGQIRQILKSGVVRPTSKVACITYTNKAAINVEERVGNNSNNLEVSTIHAFLYAHIIKPYFHLIAEEENFAIDKLEGHEDDIVMGYEILNDIVPSTKKYYASKFKEYSSLKIFIEKHHWQLINGNIELKSSTNNKPPLNVFKTNEVISYKKYVWSKYGLMHHDDVLYFSYKLIQKFPSIIDFLVAKFPFMLIDEYQDTNSIQHYIFQQLAFAGTKVTIIGDTAQSIYRFAGSDIKNIISFKAPNLKCYKIEDNRRSTQSILNFLNMLRTDLTQNSLLEEDFGKPIIFVGEAIDNYLQAKTFCGQEKLTSLSWSNQTANSLKLNISLSGEMNLLNQLYDLNDKRSKFVYNCLLAIENAKSMLMKDAMKYMFKAFGLDKRILSDKECAFNKLLNILQREKDYRDGSLMNFYDVINSLRNSSLPKITKGKPAELYSNLYLDFAKGIRDANEESCHLTIHKSKGLEFDNVLLVFDKTDKALDFLLNTDLSKTIDDHRLYYVACSRAKHRLFLSIPSLSEVEQASLQNKFDGVLTVKMN